jgi:hypothetical protein
MMLLADKFRLPAGVLASRPEARCFKAILVMSSMLGMTVGCSGEPNVFQRERSASRAGWSGGVSAIPEKLAERSEVGAAGRRIRKYCKALDQEESSRAQGGRAMANSG